MTKELIGSLTIADNKIGFLTPYRTKSFIDNSSLKNKNTKFKNEEDIYTYDINKQEVNVYFEEDKHQKIISIELDRDEKGHYQMNDSYQMNLKAPYYIIGDKESVKNFKTNKTIVIVSPFIDKIKSLFKDSFIKKLTKTSILIEDMNEKECRKKIEEITTNYFLEKKDGSILDEMDLHDEDYFILQNVLFVKSPGKMKDSNGETQKYSHNVHLLKSKENDRLVKISYVLFYL